jgi:hypothetical protein
MSTTTITETPTTTTPDTYTIEQNGSMFVVLRNGVAVTSPRFGDVRYFTSRSAARKHITRERRGNFAV